MKMYLISDNIDTLTGMRLAGVEGAVVHKREELKEELDKALADKTIGIILHQSTLRPAPLRPVRNSLRQHHQHRPVKVRHGRGHGS